MQLIVTLHKVRVLTSLISSALILVIQNNDCGALSNNNCIKTDLHINMQGKGQTIFVYLLLIDIYVIFNFKDVMQLHKYFNKSFWGQMGNIENCMWQLEINIKEISEKKRFPRLSDLTDWRHILLLNRTIRILRNTDFVCNTGALLPEVYVKRSDVITVGIQSLFQPPYNCLWTIWNILVTKWPF